MRRLMLCRGSPDEAPALQRGRDAEERLFHVGDRLVEAVGVCGDVTRRGNHRRNVPILEARGELRSWQYRVLAE